MNRFFQLLWSLPISWTKTNAGRFHARRSRIGRRREHWIGAEVLEDRTLLSGEPLFPDSRFDVGDQPLSVAMADFNGDGASDLVTANFNSSNVSVLLGNGNGKFQAAQDYAVGNAPYSVTTADFDGDNRIDLAVANNSSDSVSVLLGNGDGTFQTAVDFAVGDGPRSVTTGDFNDDGAIDLATANINTGTVSVLFANGDGSFQAALTFGTLGSPRSLTAGDFNGDNLADVAVASYSSGQASVFLSNGDGTFQAAQNFSAGNSPQSVATGDFNNDNATDLITGNVASGTVAVLFGNGDGTFQSAQQFAASNAVWSVTSADVNGDGATDVITANYTRDDISVLLGNGNGTFQAARSFGTGDTPQSVTTGDFNGDSVIDVAVANAGSDDVSVLLGDGDGTFVSVRNIAVDENPEEVVVGDFNGDGVTDLATANFNNTDLFGNKAISLLYGNGDGSFQTAQTIAVIQRPQSLVAGDFNADGRTDLAAINPNANSVTVLLQGISLLSTIAVGSGPVAGVTGDFNGDRLIDLAIANVASHNVSILLGNGDGAFRAAQNFAAGTSPRAVAAADIDGDGDIDLVAANPSIGQVSVLLGNGNGTFQTPQSFAAGDEPNSVVTVDVNGDNAIDIVTANETSADVSVLVGNGDGTFQPAQNFATGNPPSSVTAADFDRDGVVDLATAESGSDDISVLVGNGDGTFQAAQSYAAGESPRSITTGDFDADDVIDLVTANNFSDDVSVLLGTSASPSPRPTTVTTTENFGPGSLRQAIINANNNPGVDTITFDIPGPGPHRISVGPAGLPAITDTVMIDGWSEPDFAGTPVVELHGNGYFHFGLELQAGSSGSQIRGLVINRFGYYGILILGSSNNVISGNYIGTDVAGMSALGNTSGGIEIISSQNNLIGGSTAAARNVISGNVGDGLFFSSGANGNRVSGNYIGVDATGANALGNGRNVRISFGKSNVIGTDGDGSNDQSEGNVISGGHSDGVLITSLAESNVIAGNFIGTAADGTTAIGNSSNGIRLENGANQNRIGTNGDGVSEVFERNIIAGSQLNGVEIVDDNTSNNTVAGNVISGNREHGILIDGMASNNVVAGNLVGLDGMGNVLANNLNGISIVGSGGNRIGTDADGQQDEEERNIVSGNGQDGIAITGILVPITRLSVLDALVAGTLPNRTASGTIDQADLRDVGGPAGNFAYDNPVPGGGGDDFGFVATGQINVVTPGTYVFRIGGDDGSRLRIDGADVVVDDLPHGFRTRAGSVVLSAGLHSFEWAGFDAGGGAGWELAVRDTAFQYRVLGDPNPAPELALAGSISVTAYSSELFANDNIVAGNYIGTDPNGQTARGNLRHGINIESGASNNDIGGSLPAERNVISGNDGDGIRLDGAQTIGNRSLLSNGIGTTVDGGALLLNTGLAVDIAGGATLSGSGTINGGVSNDGTLAPGNSPGIITINGDYTQNAGGTLDIEIAGTNPLTPDFDQLIVNGTVTLAGALDGVPFGGVTPGPGDSFQLITNDGTDPVIGTFAGLPERALLSVGGISFLITYAGGDGNDVALIPAAYANDDPETPDDPNYTTDVDTPLSVDGLNGVLANDFGDPIEVISNTNSINGATVMVNPDGSFTYDPSTLTPGTFTSDTFTYEIATTIAGALTPGSDFAVDASLDADGDDRWEDQIGTSALELLLDNLPAVARVTGVSGLPGITAAYDFPGGYVNNEAGAQLVAVNTSTAQSFQNAPGDWSNDNVTFEIWFKPDNLAPTAINGQILFEDGGGTGVGFYVDDNLLRFRKQPNAGDIAFDISGISSEFIQAIGTYEVSTGVMNLYINGQFVGTDTAVGGDWTGGDPSAIGTRGGANAGGIGGGQAGTESFDGQIAIFRIYDDQLLNDSQVLANYEAVAGATYTAQGTATITLTVSGSIPQTIVVINTNDSGPGSLRQAILDSNTSPDFNTIEFNIPGVGPHTISLLSPLPAITDTVTIDGWTEPGFANNPNVADNPVIELDGTSAGAAVDGLRLVAGSDGSTIRGLAINRFGGDGIEINASSGNVVEGNYLGTDVSGTMSSLGNGGSGVRIAAGASNNRVGTDGDGQRDADERNIISANGFLGVEIVHAGTDQNIVAGNYIGTDVTGAVDLGNAFDGVAIWQGAAFNRVGTDGSDDDFNANERNVISGNDRHGVFLLNTGTSNNVIAGNLIGTNAAGDSGLGNAVDGVRIVNGASSNYIGTNGDGHHDADEGNVISANLVVGVNIAQTGTDANVVAGNRIGTDAKGTISLGNTFHGIMIQAGAAGNRIRENLVSGNLGIGIAITGPGTENNLVAGNSIGIDKTGTAILGNHSTGIVISNGAANNRIGGSSAAERNVISGNTIDGVRIVNPGTTGNRVQGNYIGTDAIGKIALGNLQQGVNIFAAATGNFVGTDGDEANDATESNLISGNQFNGVNISQAGTQFNIVAGNRIGTDAEGKNPLGNGFNGVTIQNGATSNFVGTDGNGKSDGFEGNVISGNRGAGVLIRNAGTDGNVVAGNDIGTDITGTVPLGNGSNGLLLQLGASANVIGGSIPAARNVISANGANGVLLSDAGTTGNLVMGNSIGTDERGLFALGNVGSGVRIQAGAAANFIGADGDGTNDAAEGNTIASNSLDGVTYFDGGAAIRGNSIYSNGGLGIDYLDDGVTVNGAGVQDFPVFFSVQGGAATRLLGSISGPAGITLMLDFYANAALDPSGFGEGRRYLGSTSVTTNSVGAAGFDVTLSAYTVAGESVTATATAAGGSTSEFSLAQAANFSQPLTILPDSLIVTILEPTTAPEAAFGLVTFDLPESRDFRLDGLFEAPDPDDQHTVFVYWGDGTSDTLVVAPGELGFSFDHVPRRRSL